MDNQVENRRSPNLNLPAELKVEIVDCLSLENAVHFLVNVPNRLIIHHCALRVRRMFKMIDKIAAVYARTLPAPDSDGYIRHMNGNQYTLEMDFFLRYGAAHREAFGICRDTGGGFTGYPANFFDDLIKHYYQTNVPAMAVRYVSIQLPWANPALWPMTLFQPQAGEMKLEKKVDKGGECVTYILRNKNNPSIAFELCIFFQRGAKCYQQMTSFVMWRVKDVQSGEA